MNYFAKGEFERFYEKYNKNNLKKMLNLVYDSLSKQLKHKPKLDEEGYKELLCAILLFKYDKLIEAKITVGMCKLFEEKFDELDFCEYMEEIIQLSNISLSQWKNLYDYIERNHTWIEEYKAV